MSSITFQSFHPEALIPAASEEEAPSEDLPPPPPPKENSPPLCGIPALSLDLSSSPPVPRSESPSSNSLDESLEENVELEEAAASAKVIPKRGRNASTLKLPRIHNNAYLDSPSPSLPVFAVVHCASASEFGSMIRVSLYCKTMAKPMTILQAPNASVADVLAEGEKQFRLLLREPTVEAVALSTRGDGATARATALHHLSG